MPNPNQNPMPGDLITPQTAAWTAAVFFRGWAYIMLALIHKEFGVNTFSFSLGSLGIMVGWMLFTGYQPMILFIGVWFLVALFRRAEAYSAERRGELRHSYFMGNPIFAKNDLTTEGKIALGDCLISVTFGVLVHMAGFQPLGVLMCSCCVPIAFLYATDRGTEMARVRAMNDAHLAHKRQGQMFRGRRF